MKYGDTKKHFEKFASVFAKQLTEKYSNIQIYMILEEHYEHQYREDRYPERF